MYSVSKPWGSFHVMEEGLGYKIKRLSLNPGGKVSLQSHRHRSEHWTVVNGTAHVTVGTATRLLERAQSIDVPLGAVHRIENRAAAVLDIIEVQFGDYLGEDDIIRYDDIYHRE